MSSHLLLILGLLFPLISWLTLAGSWWTARRSGGHSSPVLVPFVGPLVLTWWLWQQGARGWTFALPWVLDIGTVMFLYVLPRLVAEEWRTSRFTRVLALTGSQGVAQVRISLHSGGHYLLKKRWNRAPGELGTIALSEPGTYVQGAAGSLELRSHAGKVRRLALDADHGYLVSDPGDAGDRSLDGWRLQASVERSP
ncbi:hypothetical protein HNP48_002671 [Acidovorax soli]|uniref:Uncharacterized protein n=1 Tax=Acidovorax soli TaxID=592050 RepID=A0A7X0PE67_9BURK|nr:hypothetical protein [Acidovorax soli]MBB6559999.1 hypothetical protein [Acidovorax soli]